jgi:hypothetical protein
MGWERAVYTYVLKTVKGLGERLQSPSRHPTPCVSADVQ